MRRGTEDQDRPGRKGDQMSIEERMTEAGIVEPDTQWDRIGIIITKELKRKFQRMCFERETTMTDVLMERIMEYTGTREL